MKRMPEILLFIVFAICTIFFACSGDKNEEGNGDNSSSSINSNSGNDNDSSNSNDSNDSSSSNGSDNSSNSNDSDNSSNSGENSSDSRNSSSSSSSANGATNNSSSSQGQNSSNSSSSSSSRTSSSSSNTPSVDDPGANCSYQPIWCGGMSFSQVKTANMNETDVGATDKGQDRPNCIYATVITEIGNESAGISINGKQFANGSASRCGGGEWGDATACATKFASIAKVDGGYYIYVPEWAGQNFKTTGGTPACANTPINPASSSSTAYSSSAASGNTGTCVEPMKEPVLPPNGTKSCIKVGTKCYTCNPDRGNDCSQGWIWQGGNVNDQYWYKEVSCSESGSGNPTYNLTCAGLASTGIAGNAITQPTVKCNGDNATATFASAPTWNNPTTGTYNVSATANCGGNKTVSCGTIVISAAPSTDQLTCTGLAQTGIAGNAITQPTVKCGNTTISNPIFTGGPTWNNPTANTYTVSANATGACTQAASCGTIKISPKLSCGNPSPQTVTAGNAVTAPTVQCGTTTIATANVSWSGAPDYWSGPASGTYDKIKATVNSGDCSGQTATCGTLTVGNKLTCGNIAQSITTGQTPTKPSVTCGSTAVTSGITWNPSSINSAITTAQIISNITATASCGGSNQTATCTGSITVTAQQTTPSSSSGGGGGPSYTPTTPGNETAKTTQYWDACKPSCGWSGKPGVRASSCNITGGGKAKNDERSACDNGGNSFTCMDQAPWKVGNVSFGYAAIPMGQCGDCYQLDFPNGHVMVVMNSNTGNLNEGAKFDIMIPGGGAGDFDALTRQVQNSGVSNPDMGSRYGGFRLACNNSASCVKQKCDATFKNLPDLRAGCNWYADNLGNNAQSFDNPTVKYKKVTCPSELTSKY